MPTTPETINHDLEHLSYNQLEQVANFIAFLKFRDKSRRLALDPGQLATLATEFAEEDHALAEAGMSDYLAMLEKEDQL